MHSLLGAWAAARGYRAGWFGPNIVEDGLRRVRARREHGEFDSVFHQRTLAWIDEPDAGLRHGESSVVLVAVPRPAHTVTFDYGDRRLELILPPTYYDFIGLAETVRSDLEGFLAEHVPLKLRRVKGPLKTLATMTGFAHYGRNNITYVTGFGSYHQLVALACGVPHDRETATDHLEPAVLDSCGRCTACQKACPTGAIGEDRFLLHAEKCLTWFSEYPGPLPAAFAHARRPCLVGCLVCQEVCPANRGLLRLERLPVHFTQDETAYLLDPRPRADPSPLVRQKVEGLRCSDCEMGPAGPDPHFSRNLAAALAAAASG